MNWDFWTEGADGHDYCESIYQLAKNFNCTKGLEIGVRFGKSALAFLLANPQAELIGIDPNPEFPVTEFLEKHTPGRFALINDFSPGALKNFQRESFDWVYIDGEHTKEAVWADFKAAWPLLKTGGTMVFDDYRKDQGYDTTVADAVDEILEELQRPYLTMESLGLHPNPHGAAILLK